MFAFTMITQLIPKYLFDFSIIDIISSDSGDVLLKVKFFFDFFYFTMINST